MKQGWHRKNLGDAMFAQEGLDRISAFYRSIYGKAGDSRGAAVFYRHESEGRLHCEVLVYFSPAAIALADAVKAKPCERPVPDGLGLLAGPDDVVGMLFPAV